MALINQKEDVTQAVILAGGKGERLRPLTDHVPKPMVDVNGAPFLDYLIGSIADAGIQKALILVGYKKECIMDYYSSRDFEKDIEIEFSEGAVEDDTGRRLLNAYNKLDDRFLLMYGDNFWPIELDQMAELCISKKARVMTTVFRNTKGTSEYGFENNIEVSGDQYVLRYDKSRSSDGLNGVDIGYFIVDKSILDISISENISFEKDCLPQFIESGELIAHLTDEQYYFMTNIKTLKDFQTHALSRPIHPLRARELT